MAVLAVGRFAPSLTGGLHFGSLVTALASFLDIRQLGGKWYLRLDDLDYLRTERGARIKIEQTLLAYGFNWDAVVVQSQCGQDYEITFQKLNQNNFLYRCSCTRARLRAAGGDYDDYCRKRQVDNSAETCYRLSSDSSVFWSDIVQSEQHFNHRQLGGDFIVKRKDGVIGYQLATVVDDQKMLVNRVVRGADLLPSSARQCVLFQLLDYKAPQFAHIPVAVDATGAKLSKQTQAAELPLAPDKISLYLVYALRFLGQSPPIQLRELTTYAIMEWGFRNWDWRKVPQLQAINSSDIYDE